MKQKTFFILFFVLILLVPLVISESPYICLTPGLFYNTFDGSNISSSVSINGDITADDFKFQNGSSCCGAGGGGGISSVNGSDINVSKVIISSLIACDTINTTDEGELICGSDSGAGGDTNETPRVDGLVNDNATTFDIVNSLVNESDTDTRWIINTTIFRNESGTLGIVNSFFNNHYMAINASAFNATYDSWNYNQTDFTVALHNTTWSTTFNTTYDLWAYNQTDLTVLLHNTTWSTTFNTTYDRFAYNQSDGNASNCGVGEFLDGENICKDFNASVSSVVDTITYFPYNITLTEGTSTTGGSVSSLFFVDDEYLNISEDGGGTSILLDVNFTGVIHFNRIVVIANYSAGSNHDIHVLLEYCDVRGTYQDHTVEIIETSKLFGIFSIEVGNVANHICDEGNVSVRLDHTQNGINTHSLSISKLVLEHGQATSTTSEADPFAFHLDGDRTMMGDGDWGGYNLNNVGNGSFDYINASLGFCDASGCLTISQIADTNETVRMDEVMQNVTSWNINESLEAFNTWGSDWNSTFNFTYDLFAYNHTDLTVSLHNTTWSSTFNGTYDLFAYNQTEAAVMNNTDAILNQVNVTANWSITDDSVNFIWYIDGGALILKKW